jgi:hypothetical protein
MDFKAELDKYFVDDETDGWMKENVLELLEVFGNKDIAVLVLIYVLIYLKN